MPSGRTFPGLKGSSYTPNCVLVGTLVMSAVLLANYSLIAEAVYMIDGTLTREGIKLCKLEHGSSNSTDETNKA